MDHGDDFASYHLLSGDGIAVSQLQIKPNEDNGDLPKQMEFDFNKKELEPIPFCDLPFTLNVMLNLDKFTELLKGDKKD